MVMNTQEHVVMRVKDGKDAKAQTVFTLHANVHEIHKALEVDKDMRAMALVKGIKVDWQNTFRKKGETALTNELDRLNIEYTIERDMPITVGETDEIKAFKKLSPGEQAEALAKAGITL
jgi:hypothetical protein